MSTLKRGTQISKNYVIDSKVIDMLHFENQVMQGNLVFHQIWGLKNYGFLQNMQYRLISNAVRCGQFYTVIKILV